MPGENDQNLISRIQTLISLKSEYQIKKSTDILLKITIGVVSAD